MKKLLVASILSVFAVCNARANIIVDGLNFFETGVKGVVMDINDTDHTTFVFEYGGKTYYVSDLESFFEKYKDTQCLLSGGITSAQDFYVKLLNACKDGLGGAEKKALDTGRRLGNVKEALTLCLLTKESMISSQKSSQYFSVTIPESLKECVNKVVVHTNPDTCPVGVAVESQQYKDELVSVVNSYAGTKRHFGAADVKSLRENNAVYAVFTGRLLLMCYGSSPQVIMKPAFSGLINCQGSAFESIPGIGGTPDGVYLARGESLQTMSSDQWKSWGKYRMPLIPAKETDTNNRTNMYLHGTSDVQKRQSGGCVSMGTNIDELVEGYIRGKNGGYYNVMVLVKQATYIDSSTHTYN